MGINALSRVVTKLVSEGTTSKLVEKGGKHILSFSRNGKNYTQLYDETGKLSKFKIRDKGGIIRQGRIEDGFIRNWRGSNIKNGNYQYIETYIEKGANGITTVERVNPYMDRASVVLKLKKSKNGKTRLISREINDPYIKYFDPRRSVKFKDDSKINIPLEENLYPMAYRPLDKTSKKVVEEAAKNTSQDVAKSAKIDANTAKTDSLGDDVDKLLDDVFNTNKSTAKAGKATKTEASGDDFQKALDEVTKIEKSGDDFQKALDELAKAEKNNISGLNVGQTMSDISLPPSSPVYPTIPPAPTSKPLISNEALGFGGLGIGGLYLLTRGKDEEEKSLSQMSREERIQYFQDNGGPGFRV